MLDSDEEEFSTVQNLTTGITPEVHRWMVKQFFIMFNLKSKDNKKSKSNKKDRDSKSKSTSSKKSKGRSKAITNTENIRDFNAEGLESKF